MRYLVVGAALLLTACGSATVATPPAAPRAPVNAPQAIAHPGDAFALTPAPIDIVWGGTAGNGTQTLTSSDHPTVTLTVHPASVVAHRLDIDLFIITGSPNKVGSGSPAPSHKDYQNKNLVWDYEDAHGNQPKSVDPANSQGDMAMDWPLTDENGNRVTGTFTGLVQVNDENGASVVTSLVTLIVQ